MTAPQDPSRSERIALVTGGSRGLGKHTARKLAELGIGVVLTYHTRAEEAETVVGELRSLGVRAVALQLDAGRSDTFEAFARQVGEALASHWQRQDFDILINNAGIGVHKPFAETSEQEFDALLNIHLKGVFFLTQRLLTLLADGGQIVNISTGLARFTLPGYAAYASMKGAVEVLTRYLAKELGPRGIAVNTIAPGAVETDFGGGVVRDNRELNQLIASMTAMGRVGLPDDIAAAIASLVAGHSQWITGQRIEVSGGQSL